MTFKTYLSYNLLCEQCFSSLVPLNKWRKDFIKNVLWLFLSISGRVNFSQLGRYGKHGEQCYRRQFEKPFDFMGFNSSIVKRYCGNRKAIAFDPSYIPKAGKHTPGLGRYWSGCAGKVKRGLEICGIAAIDLENHTAMHLEAVQTILKDGASLIEFYANILTDRAQQLLEISDTVVGDAYFSKSKFVDKLLESKLHVVSRFRDDVRLQYPAKEDVKTGKKGRPKKFEGQVNLENLDMNHFVLVKQDNPKLRVYCATLHAVALKRIVKVVFVQYLENETVKTAKVYFSTKMELTPMEILEIYQTRFQIEFIYRDAKQNTALNASQARSENKLYFHFNISLTAINVAKAVHWFPIEKEKRNSFSMNDIKIMNHNLLLLDRFIATFAIKPNMLKNNQHVKELILYGTKAA